MPRTVEGPEPPRESAGASMPATLVRALGVWLLVFYGLGTIIGAGIYVLVGTVVGVAGMATPFAFVLAGVLAGLTGLSYAELAARYPEAAGAAAYVKEGFGSDHLSRLVGFAVISIGVFLTASLARGAVGYIEVFVAVPELPTALALVAGFMGVACVGVAGSLRLAALMTLVEVTGLVLVIAAGAPALSGLPEALPRMVPTHAAALGGVMTGAFFAFFAFLGFEDIVNMAEEARQAERTVPRAIMLAIGLTTALYALVALVAVLAVPIDRLAGSRAPLELVAEGASWIPRRTLAAIALVAVPNGILITLIMLARILYGMARRGWLPAALGHVNRTTRTPVRATMLAGIVVALVVLASGLTFEGLVTATSAVTLCVFTAVNLSLARLHRTRPRADLPIRVPGWCPWVAALCCAGFLLAEFWP